MMHATIVAAPFNLFDVSKWTDAGKTRKNDKARHATDEERRCYLGFLVGRAGLAHFDDWDYHLNGITCGRQRALERLEKVEVLDYETLTTRIEWRNRPPEYETGAYSIPMPGRITRPVTMETLDESGDVISSQTLPVDPKKLGVIWDREAVRTAAGPIAKTSKVKKPQSPVAVAVDIEAPAPAPVEELAPPAAELVADAIAVLTARLDALESQLSGVAPVQPVKTTAPDHAEREENLLDAISHQETVIVRHEARIARLHAARVRTINVYLAQRRDRALLRSALEAVNARCLAMEARADEAETRNRGLEITNEQLRERGDEKRRRAVLFGRNLQNRLNCEYRLVDKMKARFADRVHTFHLTEKALQARCDELERWDDGTVGTRFGAMPPLRAVA